MYRFDGLLSGAGAHPKVVFRFPDLAEVSPGGAVLQEVVCMWHGTWSYQ